MSQESPALHPAARPRTNPWTFLAVLLCALAVLAGHAWYYRSFMVDDAFISLRYSDRFLHGHGLTWNDGEFVEGYSNLLWVLGCALLGRIGLDLVAAARVLGFLGSGAAMAAILWVNKPRAFTLRETVPGLGAALAMALSGSVAIWTVGGLEQPLLAGLLAWALALSFPLCEETGPAWTRPLAVGVLLGLVAITRPDGAVFAFAVCLGILIVRGSSWGTWRSLMLIAAVSALFVAGQLLFRLNYYHEWLPNSAYAKLGFTPERFGTGLEYVGGTIYLAGLLLPVLLSVPVIMRSALRKRASFLGIVLAVWLTYLVAIGGDFFPGRRHLVPAVVVVAYLFAITLSAWVSARGRARIPIGLGAVASLTALGILQFVDPRNAAVREETWVWDGEAIGTLLADAFGKQRPLLAVDPAGCVPYFSKLPSVDMLGINDYYLAHHRPQGFGKGILGHELGSGAYVRSRNPDLVLFNLPTGGLRPYFRSGREMVFDPGSDFLATFRPVTFESRRPRTLRSIIWARVEGGALGIRRTGSRVVIPGFLLAGNENSVARLDGGQMGVIASLGAPAVFVGLPLSAGHWSLRCVSHGSALKTEVLDTATRESLGTGGDHLQFRLPSEARLALLIEAADVGSAHIRSVLLERLE